MDNDTVDAPGQYGKGDLKLFQGDIVHDHPPRLLQLVNRWSIH